MTELYNVEAEILRLRRRNLLAGQSEIVILGDGRGTGDANLYDGIHRLWVRWPGSINENGNDSIGVPFSVLAGSSNYICEINQQVYIRWYRDGRGYQIEGPDPVHMAATGRAMTLLNPHNAQNNFITQGQIQSALSSWVGDLLINMQPWIVVLDDGTYIEYHGSSADPSAVSQHQNVSSYVPGTLDQIRYAVLVFNVNQYKADAEPLQIVVSTPKANTLALTRADIEEAIALRADASCKPIWAYRLEYGQTVGRPHADDRDLRGWPGGPLTIPDNFITTPMIADDAVTGDKVADDAIGLDQLADGTPDTVLGFDGSGHPAYVTPTVGMTSFDLAADSGTTQTVEDAETVTLEGGDGVDTVAGATNKVTIAVDATVVRTTGTQAIGAGLTIDAPTIPDLTNMQHDHLDADDGGALTPAIFGTQSANTVLAGPTTGSPANPAFRAIVNNDLPIVSIAKGGTGASTQTDAFDALAPTTTAGDLSYHNGTDNVRLAKGAAYEYLRMNAADTAPEWAGVIKIDRTRLSGEALSVRDAVYLKSDGKWWKIDSDSTTPLIGAIRGFVLDAGAGGVGAATIVILEGPLPGFTGLTVDLAVFASTTAGGITQTKPTVSAGGGQVCLAEMGWALTTAIVMVGPKPVEYLKRESLAADGTTTIVHHSDASARSRLPFAYVNVIDTSVGTSYASSNQDTDIPMRKTSTAVTITVDSAGVTPIGIGNVAGQYRQYAQSFRTTTTGILTQFTVVFVASTGSPSGTMTWQIVDEISSLPTGSVLATGTFTPTTPGTSTITVTSGPSLQSGRNYSLVLKTTSNQSSGVFWNVDVSATDVYANGAFRLDTGTSATSYNNTWGTTLTNDLRSTFTITTPAYENLAQKFAVPFSTTVPSVRIWAKKVGLPTGNLRVYLYDDSGGGAPNSLVSNGTSAIVLASSLSTSYGWITFTYSTPPSVVANTPYWLMFDTSDADSATNYVVWGADTSSPSYPDGDIANYTPARGWFGSPIADACFEVNVLDAYAGPCVVGRYSIGTCDIGVRYDDGQSYNPDTKTTFKNLTGDTLDVTCIVRLN